MAILSYSNFYYPQALEDTSPSQEDLYFWLCKKDILWSALTVCQRIKHLRQASSHGQHLEQQMSGHNEHVLVAKIEQTINYLIARLGRGEADDLKDIIFLSLALKCVQLPESSPGRLYELHSTTRRTMAACMEQLLPPKLTASGHQHERDDAESLAKRTKSSSIRPPPKVTPTWPVSSKQTPNPLPATHGPGIRGETAEQYLNDFAGLAAEFADCQTDSFSLHAAFGGGVVQDWNCEHLWQ